MDRFFQLSLLGLVTSGFLSVAGSGFLDTPTVVLVAIALALRGVAVAGWLALELPELAINAITLGYIGFFALDYFYLSRGLLEATVHLVCFLAVMKVLTARTNRDYLYTASIALMELVAAAMLSANLNFFAYLAVYVTCAIAAATSAEIRRALEKPGRLATARLRFAPRLFSATALITAGILTLTIGMFIILPRSANAAFRHLMTSRYHLTGFSNEVTLGQVGEIQKDTRPVMHVRPYSHRMPANLKWRGAALSHFDGHKWADPPADGREVLPKKTPVELADVLQRSRQDGVRFSYRVDLNPSDSDALFIAGTPEFLNIEHARVLRTATGGYRLASVAADNTRYEVSSFQPRGAGQLAHPLTAAERSRYLEFPPLDPRVRQLARELGSPPAIERYLRTSFGYTLDLPDSAAPDPLANFLFVRKKGHCEYFASAMTVMLRTQGIPARLVNGFQSGVFNPISGLYVIRASDAHSWVEAFLPDRGWTVFDPTPPAARVRANSVFSQLAMYLDAAETFWQEWVVNYDLNRQITLAERLQETTQRATTKWNPDFGSWSKEWRKRIAQRGPAMGGVLFVALLLLFAGPVLLRVLQLAIHSHKLRSGCATAGDATLLYGRMLSVLAKQGFYKPSWFTPAEFAASLPPSPLASAVAEFTDRYQEFRFGNHASNGSHLDALLKRMREL